MISLTSYRTIRPKGETMPFSAVVFSASQVILGHKWTDYAKECALMFPSTYATTWPTSTWTNYCCLGDKMLHIQFHVRYLSTWKSDIIRPNQEPEFSGLRLHRDHAEVVEHGVDSNLSIAETRSSIAILTSRWLQPPYFAMVTLTDSRDLSLDPVDPTDWTTMGLKPCKEFAGLVIFQLAIGLLIGEWGKQWTVTLDCIDGIAKTEVFRLFLSTTLIKGLSNAISRFVTFSTPIIAVVLCRGTNGHRNHISQRGNCFTGQNT